MLALAVISCILGSAGVILIVTLLSMYLDGCLSKIFGLLIIGGQIWGNVNIGNEYGVKGVALFNIIGIVLGIIGLVLMNSGGSSSSSKGSSIASSAISFAESRNNDPHTCGNCTKYSSTKSECRLNGDSKSAGDSCSNWC
jgi:type IV secretory pathway TrbL component